MLDTQSSSPPLVCVVQKSSATCVRLERLWKTRLTARPSTSTSSMTAGSRRRALNRLDTLAAEAGASGVVLLVSSWAGLPGPVCSTVRDSSRRGTSTAVEGVSSKLSRLKNDRFWLLVSCHTTQTSVTAYPQWAWLAASSPSAIDLWSLSSLLPSLCLYGIPV